VKAIEYEEARRFVECADFLIHDIRCNDKWKKRRVMNAASLVGRSLRLTVAYYRISVPILFHLIVEYFSEIL
jgi:hypothetical protein